MSVPNYAVVVLDELERYPAMSGAPVLLPLRQRLDVRAFGINCWTASAGAPVIGGEEQARALLAEMLARDPDAWQPAYNAASFEALTGSADAAFEHLARALARDEHRRQPLTRVDQLDRSLQVSSVLGARSPVLPFVTRLATATAGHQHSS